MVEKALNQAAGIEAPVIPPRLTELSIQELKSIVFDSALIDLNL